MTTAKPTQLNPIDSSSPKPSGGSSGVFSRLGVGSKMALMTLGLALPLGVALALYVQTQSANITLVQREIRGTLLLDATNDLTSEIKRHRRQLRLTLREPNPENRKLLEEQGLKADAALSTLNALAAQNPLFEADTLLAVQSTWAKLKDDARSLKLTPAQNFSRHSAIIAKQLNPSVLDIANRSNLIQDPDPAIYNSTFLVVNVLPDMLERMAKLSTDTFNALGAAPSAKVQDRIDTAASTANIRTDLERFIRTTQFIVEANPDLRTTLGTASNETIKLVREVLDVAQTQVNQPAYSLSPKDWNTQIGAASDAALTVYDQALTKLSSGPLQARLSQLNARLLALLLAVVVTLGLLLVLVVAIVRSITRPVNQLLKVVEKVGQGDLSQKAKITTSDEIGVLARQVNSSIDLLRDTAKRNEAEQQRATALQNNIGAFLNVTMDISGGDLTKRGIVSDDVLGNVVDSINVMTEELGYTLKDVRNVSNDVSNSSGSVLLSTQNITSSAENTAIATAQVALEVQEVGQSIARMASDANEASEAAQEALEAAQQGQQAVDSTLSGMQAIRREVQSISKRIKSLGDRSLEISEIVDTISRISAQTNLIALNAAIEASGAGSAGSRFAIVADEVRKLAESSSQATGRIAGLIKTVQNEVSEVVSSVEDGTREVEEGYRVASVAGERLKELSEIAQISARFAEQISSGAREQVAGVARVGEAVGRIAQATEQAKLSVLEGKNEAEKLQTLAGQLNENLSRFQLPA